MKIHIPITPMPAPRPRVTKNGTYNDPKYTKHKQIIGLFAKKIFKTPHPKDTPIMMNIDFYFEIPKSWNRAKRENAKWHTSRPDKDNLEKSVKDALNGIAYHDDSQVCDGRVRKMYSDRVGIEIEIIPLNE